MRGGVSDRGKFQDAEPYMQQALRIATERLGATNVRTVRGNKELALLYLRWKGVNAAAAAPFLAQLSRTEADSMRRRAAEGVPERTPGFK